MSLERWLSGFAAVNTRNTYRSVLNCLVRQQEVELESFIRECQEEPRQAMRAVDSYSIEYLRDKAPKTQAMQLSVLKTFFQDMYVDIPDHFWTKFRRRRRGGARAVIREHIPRAVDIRQVFEHLPLEARALFALIASAGTRITESVLIEFADMDLDADPPRVRLRAETTKNARSRVVFLTGEARDIMQQWLRVREPWYAQSSKKGFKRTENMERRVFPFSQSAANVKWRKGLKKAGLYEKDRATGWMTMRPHTLRKRFRTQLAAVIPVDVVEVLMGHAGYQTDAYRRFTEEELAGFYSEGEWVLYLSADRAEIEQMQKRVREVERKQERIDVLEEEVALLKLRALQEGQEPQDD